jgi:hypothetical protein
MPLWVYVACAVVVIAEFGGMWELFSALYEAIPRGYLWIFWVFVPAFLWFAPQFLVSFQRGRERNHAAGMGYTKEQIDEQKGKE